MVLVKPKEKPNLPNPEPLHLSKLKWKVLTPTTLPSGEWVYISLTPKQYEVLAQNQAELLRWITEASWRLKYYRGEEVSGNEKSKTQEYKSDQRRNKSDS